MLATKCAERVKSLQEQPIWISGAVKPVQNSRVTPLGNVGEALQPPLTAIYRVFTTSCCLPLVGASTRSSFPRLVSWIS